MRLNRALGGLEESATLRLNSLAKKLAAEGKPIVNLTAGELDFETPTDVKKHVGAQLHINKYTANLGTADLRRAIAESVNKKHKLSLSEGNVAVTAGAKQGLFLTFQTILNPGDEVIIPVPGWVSYEQQVKLCGGKPVFVPLTARFDLDVNGIEKAITKKTRAILINSPHNPTGAVFSPAAVRRVLAVAKRKGIVVIADEIYGTLVYEGAFVSALDMKPDWASLIVIDGFSKSHALTGWRIGYVLADASVIGAFNTIVSHTAGNVSVISQQAALACLAHPKVSSAFVAKLKKRRSLAAKLLAHVPSIRFVMPKGAFYFFIDVRKLAKDSARFAEELITQDGLATVPGEAFGSPGYLRISFAASEAELRRGITLLARRAKAITRQ